jgi:hypothetical protein
MVSYLSTLFLNTPSILKSFETHRGVVELEVEAVIGHGSTEHRARRRS